MIKRIIRAVGHALTISMQPHNPKQSSRQNPLRTANIEGAETCMPAAIEQSIASAFESVENVESVYLRHSGPTFTVFPVINQEDERTLDRIFDCEISLRRFLQNVNLEFEIIVRHDRDVREFVGENSPVWYRKVEKISAAQR